ncbi:MAG: exopolysaccharide Pel transporter PelG [Gammaproteobacteria bacterium]|nr:exopolysaccharide Pel transporter PelG [Gammaproteobacteria bacterium]
MAGIGFELRKLLRRESYVGLIQAYGFAGIISAGPWVLSIVGVMLIGVLSLGAMDPPRQVAQFLVSVTYLMAASLILTGALQLMFTRFVADRLFEKRHDVILPNLMGALTLTTIVSGLLGSAVLVLLFDQSLMYRLLMLASFVTLCNIWITVIFLASMKDYLRILGIFFIGYAVTVAGALLLRPFGLEGLLMGFLWGHATLFFLMLALLLRHYPGDRLIAFDFLQRRQVFYSLAATGFFYNLGLWADKFVFWFNPLTSEPIIGPLRASIIYDLPIFLAYLSIVPGMAVFLVRMETDFSEQYDAFYKAVREGDTLAHIEGVKNNMIYTVRQGIYEIFKVQGLTVALLFLSGPLILEAIGISPLYIHLFYVDVAAVGMQVVLLGILNVFFYLDKRGVVLGLSLFFAATNIIATLVTQYLGPSFYGYGFAIAVSLTALLGLAILSRKLDRLEYETFMLQR